MTVIAIPKILRDKLSDEGAEALIELFNKTEDKARNNVIDIAEGRFEKRLTEVKSDLEVKIEQVKSDLEVKIEQVKSDLEVKIANVRADLIRWMFIFWVGQVGTITAILFAFFKS